MRKVLVVEDDRFISAIFTLFLKDLGFEIIGRCKTGVEALDDCRKQKPDIVLMDIHLEGNVDGIEAAEIIQRECEVPVIFVSSDTSSEIVKRAVISNSYGYLVKPITKKELGITMELAYYKHKVDIDQRRREQSFRNYISKAPIAITIVQKGIIRYLNNLALDLFKTHYMEDIVGTELADFVDDNFVPLLESVLANENSENIEPFNLQIKTFHQKPLKVVVHASLIVFNGVPAFQMVLVEISKYLARIDELNKWQEASLSGLGPILLINRLFEVVDYNPAFKDFVSPAFDMRGHSVFTLRPWMNIDRGVLANAFNQNSEQPVDLYIETGAHILLCSGYLLNNGQDEPEKILLVLKDSKPKQ
jgi:response regulator of citrate/malate metabolism